MIEPVINANYANFGHIPYGQSLVSAQQKCKYKSMKQPSANGLHCHHNISSHPNLSLFCFSTITDWHDLLRRGEPRYVLEEQTRDAERHGGGRVRGQIGDLPDEDIYCGAWKLHLCEQGAQCGTGRRQPARSR